MNELLESLKQRFGVGVVLVTHDIDGALSTTCRLLAMKRTFGLPMHREWNGTRIEPAEVQNWMRRG